jgi:myosin heavy subunit
VQELEDVRTELSRAKMEMEELGTSNDTLEQQLEKLSEFISQVKAGNAKEIVKLSSTLAEYKKLLAQKDQEIAVLRTKTDSLTVEVGFLNVANSRMSDTINTLQTVKDELSRKVAVASVLKAENIKISAVNKKDRELSKDEYRAKDISKLKVTFVLSENKVARKGNKQVVLSLIEPNGSVLSDMATGGGTVYIPGKNIHYTDKKVIKYNNERTPVGFVYVKSSPYKTGTYRIEIYGEGYKIGESSFVIK